MYTGTDQAKICKPTRPHAGRLHTLQKTLRDKGIEAFCHDGQSESSPCTTERQYQLLVEEFGIEQLEYWADLAP